MPLLRPWRILRSRGRESMKIIEALLDECGEDDRKAEEVCVGLHWTVVRSRFSGMSHTYKTEKKVQIENAGNLADRNVRELTGMALSKEPLNASVGVAALNSLIAPRGRSGSVNDFIEEKAKGRIVTIIGRFPFNERIKAGAKKTYILEFDPEEGELPAEACEEVIPISDVNIITATSLINHTLDRLLELGHGRFNVLLGPSTPMTPILFEYGLDLLAGVKVVDHSELTRSITQGVKKFKLIGGIEPICLFKEAR